MTIPVSQTKLELCSIRAFFENVQVVGGHEDLFKTVRDTVQEVLKLRAPMVDHGVPHSLHDLGRARHRAGDSQVLSRCFHAASLMESQNVGRRKTLPTI